MRQTTRIQQKRMLLAINKLGVIFLLGCVFTMFFGDNCIATDQVFESVEFRGDSFSIAFAPMEEYWNELGHRPDFYVRQSSNWLGYVADWSICEGELWLKSIEGSVAGRPVDTWDVFKKAGPIEAIWFIGTVQLLKGKYGSGIIGKNVDLGYLLQIECGVVVKAVQISNYRVKGIGKVGLNLEIVDQAVQIKTVIENSPAAKAGVFEVGDILVRMWSEDWGERSFEGLSLGQATGMIRGLDDTAIELTIKSRESGKMSKVTIQRERFF